MPAYLPTYLPTYLHTNSRTDVRTYGYFHDTNVNKLALRKRTYFFQLVEAEPNQQLVGMRCGDGLSIGPLVDWGMTPEQQLLGVKLDSQNC